MEVDRFTGRPTYDENGVQNAAFGHTVIFVGSALKFSKRFIKIVEAEFDQVHFMRFNDPAQTKIVLDEAYNVDLIVLDEAFLPAALDDPKAFSESFGFARLVFAYSDPLIAQSLLAQRDRNPIFNQVSLLPLKLELEATISVIRLLVCGQQYIPCELFFTMSDGDTAFKPAAGRLSREDRLTKREWQVLSLVAEGKQNKEIAHHLDLSEHTIKLHMHHVLSKLGVVNRTEATSWYFSGAHLQAET